MNRHTHTKNTDCSEVETRVKAETQTSEFAKPAFILRL